MAELWAAPGFGGDHKVMQEKSCCLWVGALSPTMTQAGSALLLCDLGAASLLFPCQKGKCQRAMEAKKQACDGDTFLLSQQRSSQVVDWPRG